MLIPNEERWATSVSVPVASDCALCGLPVGRSRLHIEENGSRFSFCCPGCQQVYRLLSGPGGVAGIDFRATDLYRRFLESGIIGQGDSSSQESSPKAAETEQDSTGLELSLTVEGMWCAACAWLIETILGRTPGIIGVSVNFLSDHAGITYQPHRISPEEIAELITGLGYRVDNGSQERDAGRNNFLLRIGVAAILTLNVMMLSFALYGGFFQKLDGIGRLVLSLPLAALSAPVLFYSGGQILKRGWRGLMNGCPGMDSLIAVGACTAFGYSIIQIWLGSIHLYFDTAAMLITLVLLGRLVENHARQQVTGSFRGLRRLIGNKVRITTDEGERWVSNASVKPGDLVIARGGERIPVDGVVAAGSGDVDESVLSGEPRPRGREIHDYVYAGSLLLNGELQLIVRKVGESSSLNRLQELVRQALHVKNPYEQLADRIMRIFVPTLFFIAAGTALILLLGGATLQTAILRTITVLLIACPCALGIATPLAKTAVMTKARRRGIIIRNPAAFEAAADLDTLVFDKTGTVTEGRYCLRDIHTSGCSESEVLARVAAVEEEADHFMAREIRRQAAARGLIRPEATGHRSYAGLGVAARVNNEEIVVGSRRLMSQSSSSIDTQLQKIAAAAEKRGDSVVFAAWGNKVRALLIFGDTLQPGMDKLMSNLHGLGFQLWLVSGDSTATTAAVASRLGIDNFSGDNTPADKVELVSELQQKGRRVAMIGDGANDIAALAKADLGVAVGGSLFDLAAETADVTLLAGASGKIDAIFTLSHSMIRTIRGNLGLAFIYNIIGIPLAMAGMLNPLLAVTAMFASSLTVIANSLLSTRETSETGDSALG